MSTTASPTVRKPAPGALRVECVSTLGGLAAHADAWDGLARQGVRPGLLSATLPWFTSYREQRAPGAAWGCAFAYEGEALAGALAYLVRPHRVFGVGRPWLHVPSDVHTTGGDMLLGGNARPETPRVLIEAALAAVPGALGLRLGGLWPDAPVLRAFEGRAGTLRVEEGLGGRSIPLTGTWAKWQAGLGSNLRRNLRKARNRLERRGRLSFVRSEDAAALDRFLALEQSGWKGREEGAVACAPELEAFYRALSARLSVRGMLTWHFLEQGGRTLAAAMEVRMGAQVVLQRVAFDEAERKHSPGQLLLAHMLEGWFEDPGAERVDCLTDQPWHETWQMERTPYAALHVLAGGFVPRVACGLPLRARERLRRVVHAVRGEGPA